MARQSSGGSGKKNTPAAPQQSKPVVSNPYARGKAATVTKSSQTSKSTNTSQSRQNQQDITQAKKAAATRVVKDPKKEKKKKKKKDTNEATLPLDTPIIPPGGGYDIGYTEYTYTPKSIKVPDRDAVISLDRDGVDQALITSVLFEQLGATELVKFTKNDTIDGLNSQYSVISNIADLKTKLDTSYLIAKQRPDTTIDNGFSIRLQDKLPSIDYLFDNNIPNYVHFDLTLGQNGSLVIELDNIDTDEIVEVEIDTNGTMVEVRQ